MLAKRHSRSPPQAMNAKPQAGQSRVALAGLVSTPTRQTYLSKLCHTTSMYDSIMPRAPSTWSPR